MWQRFHWWVSQCRYATCSFWLLFSWVFQLQGTAWFPCLESAYVHSQTLWRYERAYRTLNQPFLSSHPPLVQIPLSVFYKALVIPPGLPKKSAFYYLKVLITLAKIHSRWQVTYSQVLRSRKWASIRTAPLSTERVGALGRSSPSLFLVNNVGRWFPQSRCEGLVQPVCSVSCSDTVIFELNVMQLCHWELFF